MPEGWIPKAEDLTLCLSGYPIRIRLHIGRPRPYTLEVDGTAPRAYSSLALARHDAMCSAAEWDAMMERALSGSTA
ncbi:hypothetical protein [Teichococcus aestuarii]|uniref:Uncharacterized protein n=1 Tax=Teichococcus aestuarii TaxID=568898 RepID=A0A2U1V9G0_9PROT|nr:hypothetical protein [Pseudoroseomonas aestuarii]PWC30559.1 hypothetical protein CR165_01245 [Pseudoroseomonas aestuarii]